MTPVLEAHFTRLEARYPEATVRDLQGGAVLVTVPALAMCSGWSVRAITLRFIAPNGYPVAAPDCFWAEPDLTLDGGRLPKNSQINNAIPGAGIIAQWFSWHIENGRWSANCHDLLTWLHLCLGRLEKRELIKLIFPSPMFSELTAQMRADSRESFALILARAGPTVAGWRFLVDSVYMAADGEYEVRSESEVRPSGVFRLKWEKRARLEGLALVYAHSHPHETGELPIWLAALFVLLAVGAMQSRSGGGPKCSLSAKRAPRYQRYALIKRERPDGTAPTQRDPISTLVH